MHSFGDFVLNTDTFELFEAGELIQIEPQVFDVLVYLIGNHDRVISKEELLDEIWGGRFVSESTLTTRIKQARRALGDDGRTQRYIRNVHGRGYQFVGELSDGAAFHQSPPAAAVDPVSATELRFAASLLVDDEFTFVGREDLLAEAARRASEVADGGIGALLIGGEPGIGKTRLAAEIGRRAFDAGMWTMAGRCDRHLSTSLQPYLEALGTYVDAASEQELAADSAGVADHLRSVFPSLDLRLGPRVSTQPTTIDEYAALDALAVLIERISARAPLVIVLDDVHWAGGATRALTSLLLRRSAARLLLVLTFRTTVDDLDGTVREWLLDVGGHQISTRIDLGGLASDEVSELVAAAVADIPTDVGDQVWELSDGHTLFATELVRDVRRGIGLPHLPETVAALVQSRLDRLPDPVRRLVMAGAALGPDFSLRTAADAAEIDAADSIDVVELALGAELVHEVSGSVDQFRFSHQLVPAAVLDSMTSIRRIRLHARIVDALERHAAPRTQISHHLLEAAPLLDAEAVIDQVRSTAEAVLVDHQYDTAATLLARCAELPMTERLRAEILTEAGDAFNAAGRQPQALELFERAADLARRNNWADLLAAAALGRWGQSPFRASQDRTVTPLIDEALTNEDELDDRTVARLLAKRAAFTLFTADLVDREASSARALSLVGDGPSRERLEVLEARWMAIASPSTAFEIRPLDVELGELRKELGALTTDACAPEIGVYWRGEGEALWELAEDLAADPRQRRDVDQWRTITLAGTRALFAGAFDEAREHTDDALPLGREPWGESGRVVHALVHLLIDVLEGRPEQSVETWRSVAASVPSDPMRATQAWAEAMGGNATTATAILDDIAPRLQSMPDNFMGGFGLVGFVEAALRLERHDLLDASLSVLTPISDRMLGHPWAPSLAAADLLARVAAARGHSAEAEQARAQAELLYEQLGASTLALRLAGAT